MIEEGEIVTMEIETETVTAADVLARRIETIEESYEFMLAYAAQGRSDDGDGPQPGIRAFLDRIDAALDRLEVVAATAARQEDARAFDPVVAVLAEDARKAQALVRLVLSHDAIGSQLVDELNASIHLRAVLTDLFLIDEWLKARSA